AVETGLRGGTDITGYSLLGHASEMAQASGVGLHFFFYRVPFVSGVRKYSAQWTFPGGAADNRLFFRQQVRFVEELTEEEQMLLFDPQTSGGLLLSVPPDTLDLFLARARAVDQPVWVIGEAREGTGIEVEK
ncbi:MAG: selenide, water dikinase SelD, partial [Chloroflexi bacterium]